MQDFLNLASEFGVNIDFFWQIPNTADGTFDPEDPGSVFGSVHTDKSPKEGDLS
ncbi:hypothetical protein D3C76_1860200 [compost metagenome]